MKQRVEIPLYLIIGLIILRRVLGFIETNLIEYNK